MAERSGWWFAGWSIFAVAFWFLKLAAELFGFGVLFLVFRKLWREVARVNGLPEF